MALAFWCPGCESIDSDGERHGGLHMLPVTGDANGRPVWTFDGNTEAPTFSPSVLSTRPDFVCHSFIKGGMVQFLGDCTHALKDQTVPLPDLPDWAVKEG